MNSFSVPETIREKLHSVIREMSASPHLFVRKPEKHFTRRRKLPLEQLLSLLLRFGSGSLSRELLDFFQDAPDTVSAPALVQQRDKLLPEAMEHLFRKFTGTLPSCGTLEGYRLLAVDGSDVKIPPNPADADSYHQGTSGQRGYNLLHLNALYDLESHLYQDALVQKYRKKHEAQAMIAMAERQSFRAIVLADRNYESYNLMAHLEKQSWYYLIRAKEGKKGTASALRLPETPKIDLSFTLLLTRKLTARMRAESDQYRIIPATNTFDFLEPGSDGVYPLSFRLVRFPLPDGSSETLLTNLPRERFPLAALKQLYTRRWGIETSFRKLKYTVGLLHFHGKKTDFVMQELYARLTMYNYAEAIVSAEAREKQSKQHAYQINFTTAFHICKAFLRDAISPGTLAKLLQRYLLPIRPGRSYPRRLHTNTGITFWYRAA